VVVDGHCQCFFRPLLPYDILAQLLVYFLGSWYLARRETRLGRDSRLLLFDNFSTEVDTFVADVDAAGTCDESLNLVLALSTKRAAIGRACIFRVCHVSLLPFPQNMASATFDGPISILHY
jgi:hypothetical protein